MAVGVCVTRVADAWWNLLFMLLIVILDLSCHLRHLMTKQVL